MGISKESFDFLMGHLAGGESICELGNQTIYFGVNCGRPAKCFFEKLGFQHTSVDANGLDGALKLDLQQPLNIGTFDIVTDFGTSEHVRDIYSCWKNKHDLCKVGGLIISENPQVGSWPQHGNYFFTTDFYEALASSCQYDILKLDVQPAMGNTKDGWLVRCILRKNEANSFISRDIFNCLGLIPCTDICVASHSLAWFPSPFDWVLDVGSRNYGFSSQLVKYGCNIVAVEPDLSVLAPNSNKIRLCPVALVPESQNGTKQQLICWSTGEGNHLSSVHGDIPSAHTIQQVVGKSISQISREFGVKRWAIVKLDCEGSEYGVLQEWPGPIAEQITVEFHEHCSANPQGDVTYKAILSHLSQWYRIVKHERSVRHLCSKSNYWDSLFVLK